MKFSEVQAVTIRKNKSNIQKQELRITSQAGVLHKRIWQMGVELGKKCIRVSILLLQKADLILERINRNIIKTWEALTVL